MDGEIPTINIDQITPMSGILTGGIGVTITGSGFQKGTQVYFGTQLAEKTVIESDSVIETIVPASADPGAVAVTVVNPDDGSAVRDVGFVYISAENPDRAEVLGISPLIVIEGTETEIVLHGRNIIEAYENGLVALRCPSRVDLAISKVVTGGPDKSGIETLTYFLNATSTPALEPLERVTIQVLASRRSEAKEDLIVESSKQMFVVLPRDVPVPIAQTPSLSIDKPTMVVVLGTNLDGCTLEFAGDIKPHIQKSSEDSLYGLVTVPEKYLGEMQTTFSILDKSGIPVGQYNLSLASSSELKQSDPLPLYSESGPVAGYTIDLVQVPDQQFLGPTDVDAKIFDLKCELSNNNLSTNSANIGTIIFSYPFRFLIFNRVYLFPLFDGGGEVLGSDVLAEVGKLFTLRGSGILLAARIHITIIVIVIVIITIDFPWLYGGFNEFPEQFPNAIGTIIGGGIIDFEIILVISFLNALVLPDGRLRLLFVVDLTIGVHFTISSDGLRLNFIPNNTHFVRYYSILPFSDQFPCSGRFQLADDNGQTVFVDQFGGRRSFYFPRLAGECCLPWSFNLELARFIGTGNPETVQPPFSASYCLDAAPPGNGLRRPYIWSEPPPTGTPLTLEMDLGSSAELVVLAEPVDENGNPIGPPVDIKTLDHEVRFYLNQSLEVLDPDTLPDGHADSIEEGDNIIKAAVTSVRVLDDETEAPPAFSFYPGSIVAFNILSFLAQGRSPRVVPQGLPVSVDFNLPIADYVIEPKLAYEKTVPSGIELVEVDKIERLEPHETPRKYVLAAKVTAPVRTSNVTIKFPTATFAMKSGMGDQPLKLSKTGFQFGEGRETENDPKKFFSGNLVNQTELKLDVSQTQDLTKLIAFNNGDLFPNLFEEATTTITKFVPPGTKVTGSETKLNVKLSNMPTIINPPTSTATVGVSRTDFDFRIQNEETYEEYFRVFYQIRAILPRTTSTPPTNLEKLGNFAKNFETELNSNGTKNLISQGQELWKTGYEYVQFNEKEDRPLYYARLEALAVLRTYYKRSHSVEVPADLLNKFEWSSRGFEITAENRPVIKFDPTTKRKVIITGFDPFLLYSQPSRTNTSGIAALALNKESFPDAVVRSVIIPVRFRDFNTGLIEQIMTEGVKNSSLIMTCSWTQDYYFNIDRFGTRHRTNDVIDNEYELGGSTNPHGTSAPNYLETTLPYECPEVFFNGTLLHQQLNGGDYLVLNQYFFQTTPSGSGTPPVHGQPSSYEKSTTVPASTGELDQGSGGDYLSNEIFYRTAKVRKENQPGLPTGHLHVRQRTISGTVPAGIPLTMTGDQIYQSVKDALGRFLNAIKRLTFPDTNITAPTTKSITVTNTGSTAQTITDKNFISGLTIFELTTTLPTTIAARASKDFEFKFKPVDVKNYIDTVQLKNSAGKVLHCVQMEGKGIDPISSMPPIVNFPDTVINMENTIAARIKNLTASQTVILKSAIIDPPFSLLTTLPVTIAPGAEVVFNLKFNPTTIDNFTDDLELKDDSNNLLLKVRLSGKGIAQPPIPVVATFTPRSGYPGQSIIVTGENFINVDEVRIGDDIVYHEAPVNSTQIEIIAGDVGGKIKIKTASGEGTSALVFFVRPIRNLPD